ncbi:SixA phosphatase family protein [Algoriphagus boritolerans]|uniref:Phosphohistidine phosphatase, SixA n=1 Tax=Algoriphagus boritolerans DSM 17298 = JCM 18970 TaxID=1120964 RepID=A0A1H5Y999_9BACT|nr:histidine phosphatase family protein [Algoriphagus boritolerans]SEG20227.1 phosphohistidine phosphatase, SixA [Algoriphagus boritolerans DSM 17298 = JCM 18970]
MKHLILLRHGEAGFSDGLDFQRQLTSRGKENLNRLGQSIQSDSLKVDFMYCSSSTRTRETAEIIKKYINVGAEVYTPEIYEGNLDTLIQLLENTPKELESCILIGHNPTISLLIAHLTRAEYVGLQPGMMAKIDLEISEWNMIGLGTGTLREVIQ